MTCVLALDLATRTGCAYWREGMEKPRAFIVDLPDGSEIGVWLAALYDWALPFVEMEEVTHIAIETPLIGFGDANKNFKLISAYGLMRMVAVKVTSRPHVEPIANSTMFSHWVGSENDGQGKRITGTDRKNRSIMAAHMRGWGKVTDHNIADSLGLLVTRLHQLGIKAPFDTQRGTANTLFEGKQGVRIDKGAEARGAALVRSALSFDRNRG